MDKREWPSRPRSDQTPDIGDIGTVIETLDDMLTDDWYVDIHNDTKRKKWYAVAYPDDEILKDPDMTIVKGWGATFHACIRHLTESFYAKVGDD